MIPRLARYRLTNGWWRFLTVTLCTLIVGSGMLQWAPLSPSAAVAAEAWDGVPRLSADYDRDVESWWADHPFNPASARYAPAIASPANQVNVRTQFNGSIQSAINSLPASGGTLYFPAGTYTGGFSLIGKNHVHFIGEPGTVIQSGMQNRVLGCSMAGDYGTFSTKVKDRDPQALACATTGRISDVYFKGITFDGGGSSLVAIYLAAARDIVFDNVTFQNYHDPGTHHRGIVTGNALLDNVWVRGSKFVGRERYALYLDGLHGGGVIDSTVEHGFSGGAFLFLTNDDFSRDLNGDGRVDLPEQRSSQHVVVYRNQFKGSTYDLVSATGRQILVKDNTATGVISTLANFQAKSSHIDRNLTYGYKQNRVVGNRVLQGRNFVEVQGASTCPLTVNCAHVGEYQVRDNTMDRSNTYQQPAKEVSYSTSQVQGPNVVSNNCVTGTGCTSTTPTTPPTSTPTTPTPTPTAPAPTPTPTSPSPTSGSNLVVNGSFDANTSGYPTSWRARSNAAWDGSVKHSGAGSLRMSGPAASTYSDQSLTLKPSKTYTVSYWVKTQGVTGPGISVRYAQLSPSTFILRQGDKVSGTQDWKQVSFTFTTPANYGGGRLDVVWELSAGQAWIDDLTLVESAGS